MINRIVSNWKTTSIGLIALIGLCVNVYNNGLSVSDFLLLVVGVGFIAAKDRKSESKMGTVDPDIEETPDEIG